MRKISGRDFRNLIAKRMCYQLELSGSWWSEFFGSHLLYIIVNPVLNMKEFNNYLINYIKEMESEQQNAVDLFKLKYNHALTQTVKSCKTEQVSVNILTPQQLNQAAESIRNGNLVAFPTETVYGLGANAYNAEALLKIYSTKKRPLTDPIIVHVLDSTQGQSLVRMNDYEHKIYLLLTKQFWPGPLTVVLKANLQLLPMVVTAQTGYVGIRAPKHPYARKLIEASKVPIGAPSANLFSHVSPTEPVHVFNDFYDCDISIVDGDRCEFGVESTVVKIVSREIHVLREGSLSVQKLQRYLKSVLPGQELPQVIVVRKVESQHNKMEAPGQLLKHYAPYLPCYFLASTEEQIKIERLQKGDGFHRFSLRNCALISFDRSKFEPYTKQCKFYFQVGSNLQYTQGQQEQDEQLFCSKEQKSIMREIYYLLRKCENLAVQAIVVGWHGAREGAVWDKILRSTQGQEVTPY